MDTRASHCTGMHSYAITLHCMELNCAASYHSEASVILSCLIGSMFFLVLLVLCIALEKSICKVRLW